MIFSIWVQIVYDWVDKNWIVFCNGFLIFFSIILSELLWIFLLLEVVFEDIVVFVFNSFVEMQSFYDFLVLFFFFVRVNNVIKDFIMVVRVLNCIKFILDLQGNGGGFIDYIIIVYFYFFFVFNLVVLYNWFFLY